MEFVKYNQEGFVGVVTIDRPKALNALNLTVLEEIKQTFEQIDLEKTRAVVVTGAGDKSFVAGADIGQMFELDQDKGVVWGNNGNDIFLMVENFPIPVIAAVNGFALGGGNELAMCCDIRLCSDNAIFGQPEVGLGITPGFGGTQRLARLIGNVSKAKEIIYAATNIKAEEALRLGLVSAVYPQAELMPAVMKLANRIANNAPIAVRYSKEAVNKGLEMTVAEGVALEAQLFGACFATKDQKEGMDAFLNKRKEKNFINQ